MSGAGSAPPQERPLVGGWPPEGPDAGFADRLVAFVKKGIAEAKVHTSWTNVDGAYEDAIVAFVRGLLDEGRSAAFLRSLAAFVARIQPAGMLNSLAQVLLKVAAPGVPDIYWGSELWDFSFADPDNRRPVDWERRLSTLERVRRAPEANARATARELLASPADGAIKTFVLHQALGTRKSRPDAFAGSYAPCAVRGSLARHVVAFARGEPGRRVLTLTGRLFARLTEAGRPPTGDAWGDTVVTLAGATQGARYREALTDRALQPVASHDGWDFALSDVFDVLPLGLIVEGAS